MLARARVQFSLTADEFWELPRDEWDDYCHVADRFIIQLDKEFAEVRHMLYRTFRAKEAPDLPVSNFRLLKDPDVPDYDGDFFSALEGMV